MEAKNEAETAEQFPSKSAVVEAVRETHHEVEQFGMIEFFESAGRRTYHKGAVDPEGKGAKLALGAVAYALGTYQTEQAQVDAEWSDRVGSLASADYEAFGAFLTQTADGFRKRDWFTEFVTENKHTAYARLFFTGDFDGARDVLLGAKGFNHPKADMVALLLGHEGAFVLDTNVRTVTADYLRSVQTLGHLPRCKACDNARTRPSSPVEATYKVGERSWRPLREWKRVGAYTKQPYYGETHLARHWDADKAETDGARFYAHADAVTAWLNRHLGTDYSRRTVTQMLFNAGMAFVGEVSDESVRRFDVHAVFYASA